MASRGRAYVPRFLHTGHLRAGRTEARRERRREIGGVLVDRLIEAGSAGADLTEGVLLAASGSMGPVILPKVLDMLEGIADDESFALSGCWNLTALAAQSEDTAVRNRTTQACVRLLELIAA